MTAALEGGEWLVARPGRTLPPGKNGPLLNWTPGITAYFNLHENATAPSELVTVKRLHFSTQHWKLRQNSSLVNVFCAINSDKIRRWRSFQLCTKKYPLHLLVTLHSVIPITITLQKLGNFLGWQQGIRGDENHRRCLIKTISTWRSSAVAQWLRWCATNRKVAGSIPDDVIGIFHWHIPSDRTMALGSTEPLTEMSTRSISWGVKAAGA